MKTCLRLITFADYENQPRSFSHLLECIRETCFRVLFRQVFFPLLLKKTPIRNITWQQHPGVAVGTPWHLRGLALESSIWSPRFSWVSSALEQVLVYHLKRGQCIISLLHLCLCYKTYVHAANKVTLRTQMKRGVISRSCCLSLSSLRHQLLVFAATLTWQDPPTSNSP